MSFSVTYGDALEYKGDAVLNSLGTNGAVYGRLCKNIIKGINRKDVKTLIDAQKDMPFGKLIETEGGDLQSAHVLHIVTPFKKNALPSQNDCSGGCAANAYNATGDINGVYEYGCDLFRKRIECAIMLKVDEQLSGDAYECESDCLDCETCGDCAHD